MDTIVERVLGILTRPEETWAAIKDEETSITQLFREYLVYLAACPAIAGFFGSLFKGSNFFISLIWMILFYIFSLVGVWVAAKILDFIATNLNISHDELTIFKLVTYSYTAFLLAGIFFIIPPLYWLSIFGLYGFYIYYLGLSQLIIFNKEEQFNFTIISVIAIAIVLILTFTLSGLFSGMSVTYLRI